MLGSYAAIRKNPQDGGLPIGPQIVPRPAKSVSPGDSAIRAQLDRLISNPLLNGSPRLVRFLSYCVKATLDGRGTELNQYTLGLDVFDKPDTFDPSTDPVVRVEAARLRQKLQIYYSGPGSGDEVRIQFPPKGYQVRFEPSERAAAPQPATRSTSTRPTIAILPFEDLTPNREEQSFALGLAIEIAVALSALPGVRVLSRSVVRQQLEANGDPAATCKALGATISLESTIRKTVDGLRVAVEVTDLADGVLLWAGTFTAEGPNPIGIQEEIAAACAADLALVS